jgi:hypothetical protein
VVCGFLRGHDAVQDRLIVTSQALHGARGDEQPYPDGSPLPTVDVGLAT